jgi:hypothetical protein
VFFRAFRGSKNYSVFIRVLRGEKIKQQKEKKMKSKIHTLAIIAIAAMLGLFMAGCVTESAKITEYNDAGKIVKVTETSQQDAVGKIMKEMEKKNVVIWRQGWFFTGEITVTGSETYMPCIKFSGGKMTKGHISLKDGSQFIPAIIQQINIPLDANISKDGFSATETPTPK